MVFIIVIFIFELFLVLEFDYFGIFWKKKECRVGFWF